MALKTLTYNESFTVESTKSLKLNTEFYYSSSSLKYLWPKNSRFEVYNGNKDNKFYWILRATNGRLILRTLKGFKLLESAKNNILDVLCNGYDTYNYETETENRKNGGMYFLLLNDEGKRIAISGNGKGYALAQPRKDYNIPLRQQVINNGIQKGIESCASNIQFIIETKKPILYYD